MLKGIRKRTWSPWGLVVLLAAIISGCGSSPRTAIQGPTSDASDRPPTQESTTLTAQDLYSVIDDYTDEELMAKVKSDPSGMLAANRRPSSASDFHSPLDMYSNSEEVTKDLSARYYGGASEAELQRIMKDSLVRTPLYADWGQQASSARNVSAVGDVLVEPISISGFHGLTVYTFLVEGGLSRGTSATMHLAGEGEAYVGFGNWSKGRYQWWGDADKGTSSNNRVSEGYFNDFLDAVVTGNVTAAAARSASSLNGGFGAGGNHTVSIYDKSSDSNPRFASSYSTDARILVHVVADPTAIVSSMTLHLVDRDNENLYHGTGGYTMPGGAAYGENDRVISASTSDDDGDGMEDGVFELPEWEFDGNSTNLNGIINRNDVARGVVLASLPEVVDNDSFGDIPPVPAGTNEWTMIPFNVNGSGQESDPQEASIDLAEPMNFLAAFDDVDTMVLSWDNSAQPMTNVEVHRSLDGGEFTLVATLAGTDEGYEDVLVGDYGHADYKVRGKYVNGPETTLSEYSSEDGDVTIPVSFANQGVVPDAFFTATAVTPSGLPLGVGSAGSGISLYKGNADASAWTPIVLDDDFAAAPFGLWASGTAAGCIAAIQPSDGSAGLDAFVVPDLESPATVYHTVIEAHDEATNSGPGRQSRASGVIGGVMVAAYGSGADGYTLKYAQANALAPDDNGDWSGHTVVTAASKILLLKMASIADKPILVFRLENGENWFAGSTTTSPDESGDWVVYKLANTGSLDLGVYNNIPYLVGSTGGSIKLSQAGDAEPTAGEWTTYTLRQAEPSNTYDRGRFAAVYAGAAPRLVVMYAQNDSEGSAELMSLWCGGAPADPATNPTIWKEVSVGYEGDQLDWSMVASASGDDLKIAIMEVGDLTSTLYSN